jgi:hypothetical protein
MLDVALVLHCHGRIAVFKGARGRWSNAGRWDHLRAACPADALVPSALEALLRTTGLRGCDLLDVQEREPVFLADERGVLCEIHPLLVLTRRSRLVLDALHESYRWTRPEKLARFDGRGLWVDALAAVTRPDLAHQPGDRGSLKARGVSAT